MPTVDVDEIVVISLRESAERRRGTEEQFPAGVRWRYHDVDRDPEGGRAGAYRSLAAVLEGARARGLRRVLVLEDDARLALDWDTTVRSGNAALEAAERADPDWSFLLFGMNALANDPAEGPIRRISCATGCQAYVANIAKLDLPLPEYNGRHIDQLLFCDFHCSGRPENMPREDWGQNAGTLSLLTGRASEPCAPAGRHVYGSVPILFKPDSRLDSTIDQFHTIGPWIIENLIGYDNHASTFGVVGVDRILLCALAVFCVAAVLAAAAVAKARPAGRPGLVMAVVLWSVPLVLEWPSRDAPTPCSYPCTYLKRWSVPGTLALICCYSALVSYAVVSAEGRLRPFAALAIMCVAVGWFGAFSTAGFTTPHRVFVGLKYAGVIALLSVFMSPAFVLAFAAAVLMGVFELIRADTEQGLESIRQGGRALSEAESCAVKEPFIQRAVRIVLFAFTGAAVVVAAG